MSGWTEGIDEAARDAVRAREGRQIVERTYEMYSTQAKTTAQKMRIPIPHEIISELGYDATDWVTIDKPLREVTSSKKL
jgi:hypothetical protein